MFRIDKAIDSVFNKCQVYFLEFIDTNKKEKIKQNPERQKHLRGGENCYREPITNNIRLVYYIKDDTIWLLTIGRHDDAYETYLKRLHSLFEKLR